MSGDIVNKVKNVPAGTYRLYKGSGIGHDEDSIHTHLNNLSGISEKIQRAIELECFIEAISLRLQIIDFWLRVFFVNRCAEGQTRKREFGALLDQCKGLDLDQEIYEKLKAFNKHRINAIHGYVIGKTTYKELEPVVKESKKLSSELIIYVLENTGEDIQDMEGRTFEVGDMILNWKAQIVHLQGASDV